MATRTSCSTRVTRRAVLAFGTSAFAVGCGAHAATAEPTPPQRGTPHPKTSTSTTKDSSMFPAQSSVFDGAAAQLVTIHDQLRLSLSNIIRHSAENHAPSESLAEYTTLASGFLLAHHHVEDTRLFPTLRQYGKQRSSDLSFLNGLEREHEEVHALCEHMIASCRSGEPNRAELLRQANDLEHLLLPHLATEESRLTASGLATLIPAKALQDMQREAQSEGQGKRAEIMKLFSHPLHATD